MCNKLHYDSQPIPEEGFGWKLFVVREAKGKKRYLPPYRRDYEARDGRLITSYKKTSKDWIHWISELFCGGIPKNTGFGFFLNKKIAERCLSSWKRRYNHRGPGSTIIDPSYVQIVQIKYRKGLGKHVETRLGGNSHYTIGLCQSFKIL